MTGGNRCQWEGCGAPCRVKWCADHRHAATAAAHASAHQRRRADVDEVQRMREQSRNYMRNKRAQWSAQDKRAANDDRRLQKYGVNRAWYQATLAAQNGRCAICRSKDPGNIRDWHIDHDHVTGTPRALLCHHCNLGIGNFRDNPDLLLAAIKYLRQHHQQRLIA